MKSGEVVRTMDPDVVREAPYADEHPCFGQRQGWCRNLATWRVEGNNILFHFCTSCKERPVFSGPGYKWTKLEERPEDAVAGLDEVHVQLSDGEYLHMLGTHGHPPKAGEAPSIKKALSMLNGCRGFEGLPQRGCAVGPVLFRRPAAGLSVELLWDEDMYALSSPDSNYLLWIKEEALENGIRKMLKLEVDE